MLRKDTNRSSRDEIYNDLNKNILAVINSMLDNGKKVILRTLTQKLSKINTKRKGTKKITASVSCGIISNDQKYI